MNDISAEQLARVTSFPKLVDLLRDNLEWPIGDDYGFDDIVYEYEADDLGLKPEEIAKIREIHQLRPLVTGQPWGIFFISFEEKNISVTVLRRMLRALVVKKRSSAQTADRQSWQLHDLIFVTNFGKSGDREIAIAHFSDAEETGDLPVLNVLGWNGKDTKLHNAHAAELLQSRLHWPDDTGDLKVWRENWSSAFELRHGQVIKTSKDLAIRLAALATNIRARANQLLGAESDKGPMRTMLEAFRKNLIHDLDEDGFADMFAQTISYGLLAAHISRPSGGLVADNLVDMVPKTNPFLRELFGNFLSLGGRDKRKEIDFDELGVRDVVDLLTDERTDMEAVLRDFGDRNPKEDPVIHFYERFLKEYDPQKRMQRGVFYTPRPVVNYIVRGVDEILRTEFGLPLGLADASTWGELAERNDKIIIPAHVKPNTPFVQILDPATGTGTFLVEVIELIDNRMKTFWKSQSKSAADIELLWNDYVSKHLLPRLTGFELMMAPYAIAHMKIGIALANTGYQFGSDERARIFLTNALEPARDLDMQFVFIAEALAHEALAASEAKASTPFTIIIGNPPYSAISANMQPYAIKLVEGYRYSEGEKIIEKGALQFEKNLNEDYVKFFAFAENLVKRTTGVVSFITNNGYQDSVTLRGMRFSLLNSFDNIFITDLHGDADKKEKTTDGAPDENVFEIKRGVAICRMQRLGIQKCSVRRSDLKGEQALKLDLLESGVLSTVKDVAVYRPNYKFDQFSEGPAEYDSWLSLLDIFPNNATGFESGRDEVLVDIDIGVLTERIKHFATSPIEIIQSEYSVAKGWGQTLLTKRKSLFSEGEFHADFKKILFGPFDIRFALYRKDILKTNSDSVGKHLESTDENSVCLVAMRQVAIEGGFSHCLASRFLPNNRSFYSTKGKVSGFPLFLSKANGEYFRRPNVNLVEATGFGKCIPLSYVEADRGGQPGVSSSSGRGDLLNTFGPRDLFDWIYAVLHSPGYRVRYAEFLKSDFPRIPTPKDRDTFAALVLLGHKLVALHLLKPDEAPLLENPEIRLAGNGEARVEKGYPKYLNGKVMINASRWFEDVPSETWEFHVGGYQVCQKWLKDRAAKGGKNPSLGRVLTEADILHYRRTVTALTETRRLMSEIDRVIDEHGGWPGAFYVPPPPPPTVEEIIKADESKELEFKSTFQWDVREGKKNPEMQKSVLKTLSAFMNAEGGTLVIGVTDDKEIIGLEHDLKLARDSLDTFEQTLLNVISNAINVAYANHCKIRFAEAQGGKMVCVVEVGASSEPVFLEFQGKHEFFIRRGNATVSLNASEQHIYVRQRFSTN